MGLLTFLMTLVIGIPAVGIAWPWVAFRLGEAHEPFDIDISRWGDGPIESLTAALVDLIGVPWTFLAAVAILIGSLRILDSALERFDLTHLTDRFSTILSDRWWAVAVGLGFTLLTTSVAFSLADLVPLYNRRILTRRQALPYVLGANIGTFGDTILISLLLGRPEGIEITLTVLASFTLMTAAALAIYQPFRKGAFAALERIEGSRSAALTALVALVVVPLVLLGTAFI